MNTYLIVTTNKYESSTDLTLLPPTSDPIQSVLSFHNLSPTESELVAEIQTKIGPAWRAHSQSKAVLHRTVVQTFEALREDNRFIYIKGFLNTCQNAIASELGISKGYYSQLKKAVVFYQELEATEAPHCLELYQAMTTGAQYVFATLPKETRDKLFHKYLCKKEVPSRDDLEEIRSSLSAWKKKPAQESLPPVNPEDEEVFEWTEDFRPIPKQSLPPVNISTPEPQQPEQPPLPTSVDVVATPVPQDSINPGQAFLQLKRAYTGLNGDEKERLLWENLVPAMERFIQQVKGDLRGGDCF